MKPIKIPKDQYQLINQAELARRLGKSRQYISMILNGKRKAPAILMQIQSIIAREFTANNRKSA